MDDLNLPEETSVTIMLPAKNPNLVRRAESLKNIAAGYDITTAEINQFASDDLKNIKTLQKRLEDQRDSEVRPLNTKVKEINDEYRAPKDWLADAESILKSKILGWTTEQQRIAAEEQRKADAVARLERARLEAEARAQQEEVDRQVQVQRQAEAAQRQAEAASRQAQEDAQAAAQAGDKVAAQAAFAAIEKADQERVAAEAAKSAARILQEQAQEQASEAEMTALVTTAPVVLVNKVSGISTSAPWRARITDKAALLKYISEHPEALAWVDIKMTPLNNLAKALQKTMNIPGVEAFPEPRISARAA